MFSETNLRQSGATALRVALGAMWISHAWFKITAFGVAGFAGWLDSLGLPGFMAGPVVALELIGGIFILAGLHGRMVSLALLPVLAVATWVHLPNGLIFSNANGGSAVTANNDLAVGTAFRSITFQGREYTLSGNLITLSNGISGYHSRTDATQANNFVNLVIGITADQVWSNAQELSAIQFNRNISLGTHTLTFAGDGRIFLNAGAGIDGVASSDVIKNGKGELFLNGDNSGFSGQITVNSGILSLYVLVQYKSQSLIEHLRVAWRGGGLVPDHFVTVVPPQMRMGEMWYRGTADAVLQNLHLLDDFRPDLVAIFGADHVYRMDVNQMIDFHTARQACVTVAALPVPVPQATGFGVIGVDGESRIVAFEEKPPRPQTIPGRPDHVFASMGNYLFDRDTLIETLLEDSRRSTAHDFGRTIIPELVPAGRAFAYDFKTNEVPGLKPHEERGYWRDIGTIESYWRAHMDLLGDAPRLDLDNPAWPVLASRYPRKPVEPIRATANGMAVTIREASPGGVGLELAGGRTSVLPPFFRLRVPEFGVHCIVKRAWMSAGTQDVVRCGGTVEGDLPDAAQAWADFAKDAPGPVTQVARRWAIQ